MATTYKDSLQTKCEVTCGDLQGTFVGGFAFIRGDGSNPLERTLFIKHCNSTITAEEFAAKANKQIGSIKVNSKPLNRYLATVSESRRIDITPGTYLSIKVPNKLRDPEAANTFKWMRAKVISVGQDNNHHYYHTIIFENAEIKVLLPTLDYEILDDMPVESPSEASDQQPPSARVEKKRKQRSPDMHDNGGDGAGPSSSTSSFESSIQLLDRIKNQQQNNMLAHQQLQDENASLKERLKNMESQRNEALKQHKERLKEKISYLCQKIHKEVLETFAPPRMKEMYDAEVRDIIKTAVEETFAATC